MLWSPSVDEGPMAFADVMYPRNLGAKVSAKRQRKRDRAFVDYCQLEGAGMRRLECVRFYASLHLPEAVKTDYQSDACIAPLSL